jgi:hypothetical protein
MDLDKIRRIIVYQAGGGQKLGCFSWTAAISGAVALVVIVGFLLFSWLSGLLSR